MARVAVAAAFLGIFCAAAFAQTEEAQLFGVKNFHTDLELRFDYTRDYLRDRQLPATTLETDQLFQEIMTVSLDGFIYHPRFLTYRASVGLDLSEETETLNSPTANVSSSGTSAAPEYAISGTLLPGNIVSADFSLDQYTSTINAPFTPVTKESAENELVTLSLNKGPLPTQISYGHDVSKQTQEVIGENRDTVDTWEQIVVHHNIEHSASVLSYKYLEGHEDDQDVAVVTSKFHEERTVQDLAFNNNLRFGAGDWATLASRAEYHDETGTFPFEQFTEDESLALQHTRDLSTQYGFDYSETRVGGATTELTSLQAGVTHQLYESLLSNFRVFGSHQNFAPSSQDIEGFALTETYRKRIPWGTLTVNAGGGYEITDDRTQPGLVSVVNESQTLSNATLTFLNNPNVVLNTVVVTNTAETITYFLNVDYTLTVQGTLTQIQRLTGGAIPNGTTVLVSYQFQNSLPIKFGTRDLHGRVALDLFNHLTLYVNRMSLENSVLSGVNQGQLQNLEETLLGATARWDPAALTVEHDIYDSSVTPYVADRVSFDVSKSFAGTQRAAANATYNHISFSGPVTGAQTVRTVALSYQALTANLPSINVTAGYEWDNDEGIASEYEYANIRLEYHIRGTTLSLEYQVNHENDPTTKSFSQYAFFSIRRRLF